MRAPIRIQHVVLSLQPGGLENGVVNVVNGLDPARFQSSVCCLQEAGAFAARIRDAAVPVVEMGLRPGKDIALPFRLAKLFKQSGTDLVHTRNAESFYYGVLGAKLAGVERIVHSEHGRTFSDRRIRWHVQRFLTRFTHAVFAVSEQLRSDLVRHVGIPAGCIEVLHNGVDLERFGSPCDRDPLRQAWGVLPGQFVAGSVGRLVPVKNYALLLKAAASVPQAFVVIAGDGPERAALQRLADELGIARRVRLLGHQDAVHAMLGAFDFFVLPSFSEGMSNTLLEAMAAGVCPVVSDVGGNREIVRHMVEGLVFESDHEAQLRAHLARLCAEPSLRERLAAASRARVLGSFGIDGMVRRYEELYARLFDEPRRALGGRAHPSANC